MAGENAGRGAKQRLVSAWREIRPKGSLILPGDRAVLESQQDYTVLHESFASYCSDPYFGLPDDRLHVGLTPIPYIGDLARADIFLLMLNPGLHPGDYFAEERFPKYRGLLFDSLHQKRVKRFPFLEPELSWHPGGGYWLGKLGGVAQALQSEVGSFKKALRLLAAHIATLELVPYHSPQFGLTARVVDSLDSVRLMLEFVHENLAPRAARGEVLLIATRQVKRWGLKERSKNVVLYDPSQSRAGHLTPGSPGGKAILSFLRARGASQS